MSRLTAWTAALLILIGSVWSQQQFPDMEMQERLPRFGFGLLEPLRKSFCQNYCSSSDTMPYLTNLVCAIKCPELYLPHSSTTMSTSSSTTTPSSTEPTKTSNQGSQTTATPSAQTEASSPASTKPSGATNSEGTESNTMTMTTPKA